MACIATDDDDDDVLVLHRTALHRSAALKTQEAASFKTFKFFILDVSPNMECKTLNRYLPGQYFTKPLLLQLISGRSINQRLFLASCC